eukprot:TRINITY_DN1034_c0_g5_i1.p1 TRINITY_DN1034_c0_g5~~TRINITY_DN1034_c0_g5_i1.p1  ORF type:complete len:498 (+),score=147.81 TRINITY_DN1034_c0_g5_i1:93-1586(+)
MPKLVLIFGEFRSSQPCFGVRVSLDGRQSMMLPGAVWNQARLDFHLSPGKPAEQHVLEFAVMRGLGAAQVVDAKSEFDLAHVPGSLSVPGVPQRQELCIMKGGRPHGSIFFQSVYEPEAPHPAGPPAPHPDAVRPPPQPALPPAGGYSSAPPAQPQGGCAAAPLPPAFPPAPAASAPPAPAPSAPPMPSGVYPPGGSPPPAVAPVAPAPAAPVNPPSTAPVNPPSAAYPAPAAPAGPPAMGGGSLSLQGAPCQIFATNQGPHRFQGGAPQPSPAVEGPTPSEQWSKYASDREQARIEREQNYAAKQQQEKAKPKKGLFGSVASVVGAVAHHTTAFATDIKYGAERSMHESEVSTMKNTWATKFANIARAEPLMAGYKASFVAGRNVVVSGRVFLSRRYFAFAPTNEADRENPPFFEELRNVVSHRVEPVGADKRLRIFTYNGNCYQFSAFSSDVAHGLGTLVGANSPARDDFINFFDHAWRALIPVPCPGYHYSAAP